MKFTLKLITVLSVVLITHLRGYAQDCTANAGGNVIICGSSTTLNGGVSGTTGSGGPSWTFISGPVTPVIVSPDAFITDITGMIEDGDYVFQLSHPCGTGTAVSQVTVTAHPRPDGFTAGPDITTICATTGITTLAGVIPPGFSGEWRAVNIFSLERFSTQVSTNSQFSSTTIANPTFELINKVNHEIDPAYYVILKITSEDGYCSYEDTAVVRFVPNPEIIVPDKTVCRNPGETQGWIDFPVASPGFSTSYAGSAGTVAAGTSVTLNVISQPEGAGMTFDKVESRRIYFNGMTEDGTYRFTVTVENSCGTYTTPEISFTYSGTSPHRVSFLVPAEPEQWMVYHSGNSGGEAHCHTMAGSTASESFYFTVHADDPPSVITTVTPSGIMPPGGAPTVMVTGAGTYNRVAVVTPPSGGWSIGTYKFNVRTSYDGSCSVLQSYYIHISDGNRPDVEIEDVSVCYPGTGAISATVQLPEVYKGVINSSYFQDYEPYYDFTVISRPSGSAPPVYEHRNLRDISRSSTVISNLNMPGEYVFAITLRNYTSGVGPFYNAEYDCSGASYTDTFSIHVENPVNANAGSDQVQTCVNSLSLLGNDAGTGTGTWTILSSPEGSSPAISDPNAHSTTVSGVSTPGTYTLSWAITSQYGGCSSVDTVSFDIISISPDAPTVSVVQPACGESQGTITVTAPLDGAYQYSIDGVNYQSEPLFSGLEIGDYEVLTRIGTAGCVSSTSTSAVIKPVICGQVYNDANGMTDGTINGTGTTAGTVLYAILYDETTGEVVDVAEVNADGTYSLVAVKGNNASVYISTTPSAAGQATVPAVTLPAGWVNTGEVNCVTVSSCTGNDDTPDGVISLGVVTEPVTGANFGIEQAPESGDVYQDVSYPTGGVIPPGSITSDVSGTDPEQGALNGSNASIIIDELPSNATMYYNGTVVAAGDTIENFNPSLLSFEDIAPGAVTVVFDYSFIDEAIVKSPEPGRYTLSWDTPLPVSLLYFEARPEGKSVVLSWSTASEINNRGFEIEQSADGADWKVIGFVNSLSNAGHSSHPLEYEYTDHRPLHGINFYRLRQVDINGEYKYSEVRSVRFEDQETGIVLIPNPAKGIVLISGLPAGLNQILVTNTLGQQVLKTSIDKVLEYRIDLSSFPAGQYYISVRNEDGTVSHHKLVKE